MRNPPSDPSQQQARHIAGIVSGIRKKRQRSVSPSGPSLNTDQQEIQADTPGKHSAQVAGFFRIMMVVVVMIVPHGGSVPFFRFTQDERKSRNLKRPGR
jgi:hypothetical protein